MGAAALSSSTNSSVRTIFSTPSRTADSASVFILINVSFKARPGTASSAGTGNVQSIIRVFVGPTSFINRVSMPVVMTGLSSTSISVV